MAMTGKADQQKAAIEQLDKLIENPVEYNGTKYTQTYVDAVFALWYASGKPSMNRLHKKLPNPADFGLPVQFPSIVTLNNWRDAHFLERAMALDEEVTRQLSERLISEKVAMLNDHAAVAVEMKQMAMDYLHAFPEKLNAQVALRMLVEGIRIERESRGIPHTLEKLSERSDDDLLKQIEDLITRIPVQYEALEDGE